LRIETDVDRPQVLQRADEQARADQHTTTRDLRDQHALLSHVRDATTLRLFSFIALARSTCVARSAGIKPNVSPSAC
jgi:hypothetical protein